jgi:LmbE family N-acetylglucosaminyl deacetylase
VEVEMRLSRLGVCVPAVVCAAVAFAAQAPTPQYRIHPLSDLAGAPAVSLALRRLATTGTLMYATAHPDDEQNSILALYARHFGARVALVTATRGDGGQNEIGTELFDALGVLRTEELLTAHRFDGAEQYFTRAVDFGYSFSPEETIEKWGRQEIVGDFVRHIRTIRPDVIITMSPEGTAGGQHHQVSAILAGDAYRAAADPAQFPEQLREGLRPWQALKLYRPGGGRGGRGGRGQRGGPEGAAGGGGRATTPEPAGSGDGMFATVDTNIYEPLLGCTIAEVGGIASGMHMCQGRAPMVPDPRGGGPGRGAVSQYRLVESRLPGASRNESSLFDGIDTSMAGLARFAGSAPPAALTKALAEFASRVDAATRAFESRALSTGSEQGIAAVVPELVSALTTVRTLREGLGSMGLGPEARHEIEPRLQLKEDQVQSAIVLAQSLRIDALANDGLIVPGQAVNVSVLVANRGPGDVEVRSVQLTGFDGPGSCASGAAKTATAYGCATEVRTPHDARLTNVYWVRPDDAARATFEADAPFGLPFRPTPFRARIELDIAGTRVVQERPVQFRYEGPGLTGEKRMELKVVPAFAVSVSPSIVVVPRAASDGKPAASRAREVRVTVVNGARGPASATVRLQTPSGWRASPASVPVSFTREDESATTRFMITPPAAGRAGEVEVTAEVVSADAPPNHTGYQAIEYPHVQRRHKLIPATATVKTIDVRIAPSLSVGYIMGVGDQVPAALQQLGARVTLIDSDELAWGNLSRYDAIVTGVRAYEHRQDLRANNHRLLKYVEAGGTAIVQYNRMEFNQAQFGPYPAVVSSDRVTDEHAPVKVLEPKHRLFNSPNRIVEADWQGWVQERGTYFLGKRDSRYADLVEMADPFEYNPGVKRGALVEARYGKGRWLYVGLGLWRQVTAGTDGAYRLFANLISLGKVEKPAPLAVER